MSPHLLKNKQAGLSLIEFMIALVLVSVAGTMGFMVLDQFVGIYQDTSHQISAQQMYRTIDERLAKDSRNRRSYGFEACTFPCVLRMKMMNNLYSELSFDESVQQNQAVGTLYYRSFTVIDNVKTIKTSVALSDFVVPSSTAATLSSPRSETNLTTFHKNAQLKVSIKLENTDTPLSFVSYYKINNWMLLQ